MRDRDRDPDKTFSYLILAFIAVLFVGGVVTECRRLIPKPLATEKINPAPVRGVCDWLPLDSGCPGAKKVRK